MKASSSSSEQLAPPLFPELPTNLQGKARRYARIRSAIWSEHKAKFIQQYLRIFVQITKHGAYIDGFAGPQNEGQPDSWTAELVLKSEPKWLRHFFLCEKNRESLAALRRLKKSQPSHDAKGRKIYRKIEIFPGDFNGIVIEILRTGRITQREAAFCLLDQRMFECHWATVKKLASYKKSPNNKIEILYFLGVGWLHRSLSGIKHTEKMDRWWGRSDWRRLKGMTHGDIAELVRKRFEDESGYRFAAAYRNLRKGTGKQGYVLYDPRFRSRRRTIADGACAS